MPNKFKLTLAGFVMLSLTACGGGGSSSTYTSTISGKVIDGYIDGAEVCLDLNANYLCDDGEPNGRSGSGGSYSFTYTGDIPPGTQVLAEVPAGAIDEDRGTVAKSYNLMTPAESPGVVTPLTTLVSAEILSSGKTLTVTEAETSVKLSLNLVSTDTILENDFVESEDTELQGTAEVIATALAASKYAIDNDDGRAEDFTASETAKAAVEFVKTQVLPLIETYNTNEEEALDIAKYVDEEVTSLVKGKINNIVAGTNSGDGEALDLVEVFESGTLMNLYESNVKADTDDNGVVDAEVKGIVGELIYTPDGNETDATKFDEFFRAILPRGGDQDETPSKWLTVFEEDGQDYTLLNNQWILEKEIPNRSIKLKENCALLYNDDELIYEYCFLSKDVSGKAMGDIIPDFCINSKGEEYNGCDINTKLPEGSIAYDFTLAVPDDVENGGVYKLWFDDWDGYIGGDSNQSIDNFIEVYGTLDRHGSVGDECNTTFKVHSYDDKTGKGEMEWFDTSSLDCSSIYSDSHIFDAEGEIQPFEVVEFGDTKILKAKTSKVFRANNPDERLTAHVFAKTKNSNGLEGIFGGKVLEAGYRQTVPFSGDTAVGIFASRILIDTAFKQISFPAFPYPDLMK